MLSGARMLLGERPAGLKKAQVEAREKSSATGRARRASLFREKQHQDYPRRFPRAASRFSRAELGCAARENARLKP